MQKLKRTGFFDCTLYKGQLVTMQDYPERVFMVLGETETVTFLLSLAHKDNHKREYIYVPTYVIQPISRKPIPIDTKVLNLDEIEKSLLKTKDALYNKATTARIDFIINNNLFDINRERYATYYTY